MPAASQKTEHRVKRMIALHGQGASTRQIGEEIGVAHRTVSLWLRDAGLTPNGGHGKRTTRPARPPGGLDGEVGAAAGELEQLEIGQAPRSADEVLEGMRQTYARVDAMVKRKIDLVQIGQATMTELDKALKVQDWFATRIQELSPKELPDPKDDPAVKDAAAEVRAEIAAAVETAERSARCAHCGKNPIGKAVAAR